MYDHGGEGQQNFIIRFRRFLRRRKRNGLAGPPGRHAHVHSKNDEEMKGGRGLGDPGDGAGRGGVWGGVRVVTCR